MDIQAEKLELMKLLLETDDATILNEVKAIFRNKGYDFYSELPEGVKASIDAGLADVEKGKVYDHYSVMQNIKAKYGITH